MATVRRFQYDTFVLLLSMIVIAPHLRPLNMLVFLLRDYCDTPSIATVGRFEVYLYFYWVVIMPHRRRQHQ